MNIIKLTEELNNVTDPHRQWGNKRHKLVDILVIGFCTIVCGGEDFTDMETLGIENQLHWCLDVIFREDASRAKRDNSPLNLNVLRKTALPLLQAAEFGRIGIRKKMFRAAMSIPSLEYILTGEK